MLLSRQSESRRHIEALALFEGHISTLDIAKLGGAPLEAPDLALPHQRVDRLNLYAEQALDRLLDRGLGRIARDVEDHLVLFRDQRSLFGDRRSADDVV